MNLFIDACYQSIIKFNEELCGDKVEIIRTDDSVIVVLADGLGSGVKANILATLTSKIIGTMLKEGTKVDEAVETIAHTLPICSVRKLAYSTFTILQVFNTGQAYLVEFDNPSVIFVRQGKRVDIPFEIRNINGKDVRESYFNMALEDTLVMISDGVVHAGVGSTLNLGWRWESVAEYVEGICEKEKSPNKIAQSLIGVCDDLYMSRPGDDATAAVVKIRKPLVVHLLSGPPISKDNDEMVVREFISGDAKKVICGGTTAQIVSRVLKRDIKTSLDYFDIQIPPIAYIDGVDLVTEGVLTLTKTVDILEKYVSGNMNYYELCKLDDRDGATLIANMLIYNCTCLKLYIGRAMNPAHQNPNLPVDLSIKLKLLGELAKYMECLGKTVQKFYY